MPARLTFLAIAAFWVTMNVLLWRAEFGVHGGDTPVPVALVWGKILTAPDASPLNIYQNGDRMGYCEFSTAVAQQMAVLDNDQPPPEGLAARAGRQVQFAGNVAVGDFTNRVKFDGRLRFGPDREWQEANLKIVSRLVGVEIHALATNPRVQVKFTSGGETWERDVTAADLENPGALIRAFTGPAGTAGDALAGLADWPAFAPSVAGPAPGWAARRVRVKIGTEVTPIYRLETRWFGQAVTVDVSPLGEILCVQLPGGLCARIDEWTRHD
jgi:hypothetical protein